MALTADEREKFNEASDAMTNVLTDLIAESYGKSGLLMKSAGNHTLMVESDGTKVPAGRYKLIVHWNVLLDDEELLYADGRRKKIEGGMSYV